jgi:hypothetical protein
LNRELAGSGIPSGTAPLLLELRDGEACNPVVLASAVGVDKAKVSCSPLRSCSKRLLPLTSKPLFCIVLVPVFCDTQ